MDHDLIIVGGGPVGASLARAPHGLSVALVAHERRVAVPRRERFDARVYALSPANVAFLGLALDSLTPVHAMRVYGDGDSRVEFDAYRAGVAALAYIVEDRELQDTLWQGLEPVVGRCEALAIEEERVRVTLDGARELSGRLVVAADGAESRIREFAEIKVTSKTYGQAAVVANFACEREHGNVAYQWFQGGRYSRCCPFRTSMSRWSGRCRPRRPHASRPSIPTRFAVSWKPRAGESWVPSSW